MKQIKNIIYLLLIVLLGSTGCTKEIETYILKENVAPVLREHSAILITPSSKIEDVTFTWSKARLVNGDTPEYILYGQYGENAIVTIHNTKNLSVTLSKDNFNSIVLKAGAPESDTFEMKFWVEAFYTDGSIKSEKINVKIQSQGDAIEPELLIDNDIIELKSENWDQNISFAWNQARLEANAEITYELYALLSSATKSDEGTTILLSTSNNNNYTCTQEELNDALVNSGAPEGKEVSVSIYVLAKSIEFSEGVSSALKPLTITTYSVQYPEKIYVPGSHQGWRPDAADCPVLLPSDVKGFYDTFITLIDANGGENCEFKFSPNPEWNGDFGVNDDFTINTDKQTLTATGKVNGGKNILIPNGLYRIFLNYKTKEVTLVRVETLGMIGSATPDGWNGQTNLTYDAASNTWSAKMDLKNNEEYKFRINDDWDWAIGDGYSFGGENIRFTKESGNYKVILNTSKVPYDVKFLSTNYPEYLYTPGSHQGWKPDIAQKLLGNGEGYYEGYINLVDADGGASCNWKFTSQPNWNGVNYGTDKDVANGLSTDGGAGNIELENGYYKVWANLSNLTYGVQKISKLGLIGTFNNWGGDLDMVFDASTNLWSVENFEVTDGTQFKARFNGGWDSNLGADVSVEPYNLSKNTPVIVKHDGKNMTAPIGTYTIVIDLSSVPYKITLK